MTLTTGRTESHSIRPRLRALAILLGGFGLLGGTMAEAATTGPTGSAVQTQTERTEVCSATVASDTAGPRFLTGRAGAARLMAADGPRSCPKPTVGLTRNGNTVTVVTGDATQRDGIKVTATAVYKSDATGKKNENGTFVSFEVEFPNYPRSIWDCSATGVYVPGGADLGTPRVAPPEAVVAPNPGAIFVVTVPAAVVGQQSVQIQLTCTPKP